MPSAIQDISASPRQPMFPVIRELQLNGRTVQVDLTKIPELLNPPSIVRGSPLPEPIQFFQKHDIKSFNLRAEKLEGLLKTAEAHPIREKIMNLLKTALSIAFLTAGILAMIYFGPAGFAGMLGLNIGIDGFMLLNVCYDFSFEKEMGKLSYMYSELSPLCGFLLPLHQVFFRIRCLKEQVEKYRTESNKLEQKFQEEKADIEKALQESYNHYSSKTDASILYLEREIFVLEGLNEKNGVNSEYLSRLTQIGNLKQSKQNFERCRDFYLSLLPKKTDDSQKS